MRNRDPKNGTSFLFPFLIFATAFLAARAGAIPGGGFGFPGSLLEASLWTGMYFALRAAGVRARGRSGKPSGDIPRKAACSLFLPLVFLAALVFAAAEAWDKLFYLRYLSLPLALLVSIALNFREESGEFSGKAWGGRPIGIILRLSLLLLCAAVLVSLSDLALNLLDGPDGSLRASQLGRRAWITNTMILFSACGLVYAIFSGARIALLAVTPVFAALNLATFAKMKYMHAPVIPLDLLNAPEFLPLFKDFFGAWAGAAVVLAAVAWILSLIVLGRRTPETPPPGFRVAAGALSLAGLAIVPVLYIWPGYAVEEYLQVIGAPEFHKGGDFRKESGILLSFLAEMPSSFVEAPRDYTDERVRETASEYFKYRKAASRKAVGQRPNLVVIMVESFMDPADLGYRYTSDPISGFHENRRRQGGGYVIVPGAFGGSNSSEFELLTGMSTLFLPERSVPYRQYVRRPIPSLPRALKKSGYRTVAIQADPRGWFSREKAYGLLGFDETHFLHEDPAAERCRRGWWPSDMAVAKKILQASRGGKPFFIFAFPSAAHSSYNSGAYRDSDLKVTGPAAAEAADEVEEYVNVLRDADRAIGEVVGYFRSRPDPTIVVVLGDHLPPLSDKALRPFFGGLSALPEHEREWRIRRVPFLIAANYQLSAETTELSLNVLPSYLLEKMGLPSTDFISAGDVLRARVPVYSKYVKGSNGMIWHHKMIPPEERSFVDNYSLLQYDLLFGEQHFLRAAHH